MVILFLVLVGGLTGCSENDPVRERELYATQVGGDVIIAIPGPRWLMEDSSRFLDGVDLAVEEVNASDFLGGRKIQAMVLDDQASFITGIAVAQSIAINPKVTAVVGHWNTAITIPASTIYHEAGLLLLSPVVSNVELTRRGYPLVFRNIPSDEEIGKQMALYAGKNDYHRVAVYYADNAYGRGLADAFEDTAREEGISVIDRISGFSDEWGFRRIVRRWEALDIDAVFVADSMPTGGEFIRKLRQNGITVPVMGGDGLDVDFIKALGTTAEGVVIATIYNSQDDRPVLKEFIQKFKTRFREDPDVWALQGYDSIKLLAWAMEKAKSPLPAAVAQVLHTMPDWPGTTGSIRFDASGELVGRSVLKKIVRNGAFEYIE
ncbi:MAG: ABC transporter substrate-binding protein [Atribacterota bacterium]